MSINKNSGLLPLSLAISLALTACGGGGSTPTPAPTTTALNGSAQKGPLVAGSTITAVKLNDDGSDSTESESATVEADGTYDLPIPWVGWTRVTGQGQYFDESTAGTSAGSVTLSAVSNLPGNAVTVNLNLFTTLADERFKTLIAAADPANLAGNKTQALIDLRAALGLSSSAMPTSLDLTAAGEDNALLLLLSGGLVSSGSSVASFASEFADDGAFDASETVLPAITSAINAAGGAAKFIDDLGTALVNNEDLGLTEGTLPDADDLPQGGEDDPAPEWVNFAPVGVADQVSTDEETAKTFSVVANDTDANGDTIVVGAVTQPDNGSAVINAEGNIKYTPNENYVGDDVFTYTPNDGSVDGAPVVITVTIGGLPDAPVGVADLANTTEETPVDINVTANDTDPDAGDVVSIESVSVAPEVGSVTNTASTITFTPATNVTGNVSFTYIPTDGTNSGSAVTVNVNVTNVNDAPVAVNDGPVDVLEDVPTTITVLLNNDTDVDGDTLSIASITQPANGTAELSSDKQSVTYTPALNSVGSDSFTYMVNDGTVNGNSADVSINVTAVNDAPVGVADTAQVDEDNANGVSIPVSSNDTDVENDAVTVASVSTPAEGGSVVISTDKKSIVYTPAANFFGTDTFTYIPTDGESEGVAVDVSVTVNSVDDQGVATITGNPSVGLSLTASLSDVDDPNPSNIVYTWYNEDNTEVGTGNPYQIKSSDVDKKLKVVIAYNENSGEGRTATSALTDTVTSVAEPSPTGVLNDTGLLSTISQNNNQAEDAYAGRDADSATNSPSDGEAGFSFTKIKSNGAEAGAGEDWACIKDNVTGLLWEVKQDNGLHTKTDLYSWKVGNDGYAQPSNSPLHDTSDNAVCDGYDDQDSSTNCNIEAFAARVNSAGLCGLTGWRIPTREELRSIVSLNDAEKANNIAHIDSDYFPGTQLSYKVDCKDIIYNEIQDSDNPEVSVLHGVDPKTYTSNEIALVESEVVIPLNTTPDYSQYCSSYTAETYSSTNGSDTTRGRGYGYATTESDITQTLRSWTIFFNDAEIDHSITRQELRYVRLVNGSEADVYGGSRFTIQNDEALDTLTGLTWKRCLEGYTFEAAAVSESGNDSCVLNATETFTWEAALAEATSQQDWRMPNLKELASLVDHRVQPTINSTVFPDTPLLTVWSSSHHAGKPNNSWAVSFYNGGDNYTSIGNTRRVRLVKD